METLQDAPRGIYKGRHGKPMRRLPTMAQWNQARQNYVHGKATMDDIAVALAVSLWTVTARSKKEGWVKLRTDYQSRILANLATESALPPIPEAPTHTAEQAATAHVSLIQAELGKTTTSIGTLRERMTEASWDERREDNLAKRIGVLLTIHESLSETLRKLSGIPDPDKVPRSAPKPHNQAKPQPVSRRESVAEPVPKPESVSELQPLIPETGAES